MPTHTALPTLIRERRAKARQRFLALAGSQSLAFRLPEDILNLAVARLGMTSLILAVSVTLMLALTVAIGTPKDVPTSTAAIHIGAAGAVSLLSLGLFFCTRWLKSRPQFVCNLGLVYEVLTGLLISWSEYSVIGEPLISVRGVSAVCMWMTVFRVIVPTPHLKAMAVSLLVASTGPLALAGWVFWGATLPSPSVVAALVAPNFFTAVFASMASALIYQISSDVTEERDLGSYRLGELIGTGGMGEVRRAHHRMLARDAAIKLIRREALGSLTTSQSQLLLRRFEREAQSTAALQSPHSVELFDFGTTADGSFFYVMELLTGMDLETMVRRFGPMPSSRVNYLLRQVCDSLQDAHQRGLVHRDIKPANIFSSKKGKHVDYVKVLDFGLVKVIQKDAVDDPLKTAAHSLHGTPAYLSPEAIVGEAGVDARSDLYSLGCVGYFLLTGKTVFEVEGVMNVLVAQVTRTPEPPSQRLSNPIDSRLEALVLRCLEKDPAARPQTAAEFEELLLLCDAEPWTAAQANAWWQAHLPDAFGEKLGI